MAVVTKKEVQQWLEGTKATLVELDAELVATAETVTFASFSTRFDTTGWVTPATTPALVRKIISLRVAGWWYNRVYSEGPEVPVYGQYLLDMADAMQANIISGDVDLVEVPGDDSGTGTATFYPDDSTGMMQQYDDSGRPIGDRDSAAAKFYMGTRF